VLSTNGMIVTFEKEEQTDRKLVNFITSLIASQYAHISRYFVVFKTLLSLTSIDSHLIRAIFLAGYKG
jgi:hypothetical protein